MNEAINNILKRKSTKKFKSTSVPADIIDTVINCGIHAASGMNKQETIVVAVTDKDVIARLTEINGKIRGTENDQFYGAPAILIVLGKSDNYTRVYDGSLVLGNMMLAAEALGVGSCWIHRAKETFEMPEWKEWLKSIGVDGEYEGIGHLALGYPDMTPPEKPRREGRIIYVK